MEEGNGQMDGRFKILKKNGCTGLVRPHLRAIHMYVTIIYKNLFSLKPLG